MPCKAAGIGSLALALAFPELFPPFLEYLEESTGLLTCCLRLAPSVDDEAGSLDDCELACGSMNYVTDTSLSSFSIKGSKGFPAKEGDFKEPVKFSDVRMKHCLSARRSCAVVTETWSRNLRVHGEKSIHPFVYHFV